MSLSWGRTASFTSAPRSTRRRRIGHLEPWAGGRCSVRSVASRRNPESIWTSCGASTSPTERCAGTPWTQKLYTPIKEAGVTLYEPHYPHLVPSEYKLYEEVEPEPEPEPGPEPGDVPDWDELEANHTFQVGDHFTHDGTEYEVLRVFTKQDDWAPPALLDDYYKVVTE